MRDELSGVLQRASPYILAFMAVASFATILDVAPADALPFVVSIAAIVEEHPIAALFGLTLSWAAVTQFRYRKAPVSVLENYLDILMESPDGRKVRIDRKQRIRANRRGVKGILVTVSVDKGCIPLDSFQADIQHLNPNESHIRADGTERRWDVWHLFDKPIPRTSWRVRHRHEVERTMSFRCVDAFTSIEESYRLHIQTANYPHARFELRVHFHPERAPTRVWANTIVAHGILPMTVQRYANEGKTGGDCYLLTIPRCGRKDYEIRWSFEGPVPALT